jgi:hypothetical protein
MALRFILLFIASNLLGTVVSRCLSESAELGWPELPIESGGQLQWRKMERRCSPCRHRSLGVQRQVDWQEGIG